MVRHPFAILISYYEKHSEQIVRWLGIRPAIVDDAGNDPIQAAQIPPLRERTDEWHPGGQQKTERRRRDERTALFFPNIPSLVRSPSPSM